MYCQIHRSAALPRASPVLQIRRVWTAPEGGQWCPLARRPDRVASLLAMSIYDEDTPAHLRAALSGDLSTVEAFLAGGGDVNQNDYWFGSLLSAAIVGSQTQMREYLVARGARCGKTDVYCLLEEILARPSYLEIARLLIEHGADPAMGNNGGWGAPHKLAVLVGYNDTFLERQARSRSAPMIRLLVEKGAPVDLLVTRSKVRLGIGATPLMVAVAESAPVVYLRELLRLGADLYATNEDGDSAVSLAQSVIYDVDADGSPAAKQEVLTFITDVSRAGTYKRYINEPRKRLLVLRKLVERGRARPPRESEEAARYAGPRAGMVFTTRDGATGYYRDAAAPERLFCASTLRPVLERLFCASTLPDVLFWKVLSFWRTSRDGPSL